MTKEERKKAAKARARELMELDLKSKGITLKDISRRRRKLVEKLLTQRLMQEVN